MKRIKNKKIIIQRPNPFRSNMTDPLGSYTGNPETPHDKPTQDADDL